MLRRFDSPWSDDPQSGELEGYDTAQVCLNGHSVNAFAATQPEHNENFCGKCGERTITACPDCSKPLRGHFHVPNVVGLYEYKPAAFCYHCGKSYPWTNRRLTAARELANELDRLNAEEKQALAKSLDDLIRETPGTPVAVTRFKKLVAKAGNLAAEGMKNILFDVLSEAVRKQLWL